LTSESYPLAQEVSSEDGERREQTMARMLLWCGLAMAAGWFLLSASLESLGASVGGLAAEFGTSPLHSSDLLKLVGSVTVIVVMWRWTTPKSARCRSGHRRR
jgi:hypothetical protein